MIERKSKTVKIGNISLGDNHPVIIQSMTKVPTTDIERCVKQVKQLVKAGCGLVRLAVPTKKDTEAFKKIVPQVDVPLIADVHFSPSRAIESIEAGAAKIRLNPGNIKSKNDILRIIDAAKANDVAVRAGVNEASIRNLKKDVPLNKRTKHMLRELKSYVKLFEERNFEKLVLSAKSSDPMRTIEVNKMLSENFDYPIHLGLTHAGLPEDAKVPSAVTIGSLLSQGIGDTIRVSIAGDPVKEAKIADEILTSLGLREKPKLELVVCPTCGRTQVDVIGLAKKVKSSLKNVTKSLKIAVMGCVVNGPGEAKDADLAICAGKGKGYIYSKGKKISTVPEQELIDQLLAEIEKY